MVQIADCGKRSTAKSRSAKCEGSISFAEYEPADCRESSVAIRCTSTKNIRFSVAIEIASHHTAAAEVGDKRRRPSPIRQTQRHEASNKSTKTCRYELS